MYPILSRINLIEGGLIMPNIFVNVYDGSGYSDYRVRVSNNRSAFIPLDNKVRESTKAFLDEVMNKSIDFRMTKTVAFYKNLYPENITIAITVRIGKLRDKFIKSGKYDKYDDNIQAEIEMINDWNANFEE
jgi:hypothetical protein